jgi:hypothetical protein
MGAGRDGLAELVQHRLHGGGAHRGQDQGDAGIGRRSGATTEVAPGSQPTGQTAPNR